jgi:hypothetical protein
MIGAPAQPKAPSPIWGAFLANDTMEIAAVDSGPGSLIDHRLLRGWLISLMKSNSDPS